MTFRPLSPLDLQAIESLNPPDWPPFRRVFEHYFSTTCAQPFGWEDGRLDAMGTLITFGRTAWIAQLITRPEARGKGLGRKVLTALMDQSRGLGVQTISLVATDQGYPLYDHMGFVVEGWYDFWTRETPWPGSVGEPPLRPLEDRDLPAVRALDRRVSGEDRWEYWKGVTQGGLVADGPGGPAGFWLPGVGEGLAAAETEEAGRAVLQSRLVGSLRCVIPRENTAAATALADRGFVVTQSARRMVWGPSLSRAPGLLWSRIGGNLG